MADATPNEVPVTEAAVTEAAVSESTTLSTLWSGLTIGMGPLPEGGLSPVTAGAENAVLVLGPSRSGKTSCVVVPTILCFPGALVSTSTKDDVLAATVRWRSQMGTCYVFDPSGAVCVPETARQLRWSPVTGCEDWDSACAMAHVLVQASRPGAEQTEHAHWSERAESLLSPLLHAAALGGRDITGVLRWVMGRDVREPEAILAKEGAQIPRIVLSSIWRTEERERSSIFSTASGILSPYRSEAAMTSALDPNFDPNHFVASYDTLYICASATAQNRLAPLVVALLEQLRSAAYARHATFRDSAPVVFALDEAANIAALPSLPQIASEGGGQGLVLLACMQDLSQARARWGEIADGFFSLFALKVIFPGIGDARTLELISQLGGEVLHPMTSRTRPDHYLFDFFRPEARLHRSSTTTSYTWRRRLSVDAISNAPAGTALCAVSGQPVSVLRSVPWWNVPDWRRRVQC